LSLSLATSELDEDGQYLVEVEDELFVKRQVMGR